MAWTTPRTWTTTELVTAAMMNTHVRDNLSFLAGTVGASNTDSRTFTNTAYADLDALTGGAGTMGAVIVTATTGTSAEVSWSAAFGTSASTICISFRVSGATTLASDDSRRIGKQGADVVDAGRSLVLTGLTAGVNTFELQAKVLAAATGTIARPTLTVGPVPT